MCPNPYQFLLPGNAFAESGFQLTHDLGVDADTRKLRGAGNRSCSNVAGVGNAAGQPVRPQRTAISVHQYRGSVKSQ